MIHMSLLNIAETVAGRLVLPVGEDDAVTPDTLIHGDSQTDSREIRPGGIFFAKRGEVTDGHLFADSAVAAGAALVVVEEELSVPVAQIVVEDTVVALGMLATKVIALARTSNDLKVVGITGSNGKTTTKNILEQMCLRLGATVAPIKSFNNEVGAPLTMLRVTEETKYLVQEMGASRVGDIDRLTAMAHPDIGVVLGVGLAHAGEFGGIEKTFQAKSEMVRVLSPQDVAVLNREDPRVAKMAELTQARVRWFGLTERCHLWAENVVADASGTRFTLHIDDLRQDVHFGVLGEHHVMNALAASAVASELGLSITEIVEVLEQVTVAERWRMQVLCTHPVTVINDAYNASPDSMAAALKTLAQIRRADGRTVAVLGEMTELGEFSGDEHDRIGLLAVRLNIDQVVVVGEGARRMHISTINQGAWDGESVFFEDSTQAFAYLRDFLQPGDTVLVKSSNSAGLRMLGDEIGALFA